jgi:hypothetical protein
MLELECHDCFNKTDPLNAVGWRLYLTAFREECDCDNGWCVDEMILVGTCPSCIGKGFTLDRDLLISVHVSEREE